jgi:hypothetical protein
MGLPHTVRAVRLRASWTPWSKLACAMEAGDARPEGKVFR